MEGERGKRVVGVATLFDNKFQKQFIRQGPMGCVCV